MSISFFSKEKVGDGHLWRAGVRGETGGPQVRSWRDPIAERIFRKERRQDEILLAIGGGRRFRKQTGAAVSVPLDARMTRPRQGGATYSLKHRLFRALWSLVWRGFGDWTPRPLFGWRRFLANAFGARIATSAKIYPGVRIWYPPNLQMGPHACLAESVNCYCMAPITLDAFALVSQGAHLCAGTHDVDDPHFQLVAEPIRIAENAWVAAEAFVGPGVVVGEGAVLGARGVAFRNLDAWSVYAGNPAKRLRSRKRRSGREPAEPAR